jgi:hypothetical protein
MLAGMLVSLCSCGIEDLTKQTRDQVIESNQKQSQLLDKTGDLDTKTGDLDDKLGQLIQQTQSLNDLTKQLLSGIDITDDGVHLQILTLSLQSLTNSANTVVLNPPSLMLPYAQKFAQTATSDEIIQIFYTYITDAQKGVTATDARNHDRYVSLQAAAAIAAFAPQAQVVEIFNNQVVNPGQYVDAAYKFGAARFSFIEEWLFGVLIDAGQTPSANVATLKAASDYFAQMKFLAKTSYVAQLQLQVAQVLPGDNAGTYNDINWTVDPKDLKTQGQLAYNRFTDAAAGLSATDRKNPVVQQELQSFLSN